MTQPSVVMKPTEVLLNNLFKTVLLAVCFCLSTSSILSAERFVKLHIKNDTSETFSVPNTNPTWFSDDWIFTRSLDGTQSLTGFGMSSWIKKYHEIDPSYTQFEVKQGEKCTFLDYKTYDERTSKEYRNVEAWLDEASVDWTNLDTNDSISVGNSIYGPCTLRFALMPAIYRTIKQFTWGSNNTEYVDKDGFRIGFGSIIYVPSEAYINLKIEGTPTDTSVGSTVGGGTSSSASGKNYVAVIPENSPTDVRIVLEQSTDLINWTSANQGVFSPSTSRRFFRVRAEEE